MKHLALFDFDGTITHSDSFVGFMRHSLSTPRFAIGAMRLLPIIVGFRLGLVPNWRAKEIVLSQFFAGISAEEFARLVGEFASEKLPDLIRPQALDRIRWHQAQNHRVIVVSASIDLWIAPWTSSLGIELLATSMEEKNGKITGRLGTKNCIGAEKVRRLREVLVPEDFEKIYAYGDSSGDREMLALAQEKFYKPFR